MCIHVQINIPTYYLVGLPLPITGAVNLLGMLIFCCLPISLNNNNRKKSITPFRSEKKLSTLSSKLELH
uniref:Uncharacterized protein n=1 Tax=Arundo donax TaxID=35708 RepID=A0A0A9BPG1_ARUDO